MSDRIVRASEVAEYLYCRRAWWLSRVVGYEVEETEALTSGRFYHQRHGALVWRARLARWVAYALVFLSVAIFVFLLVSGWGG
jgi:hypothetical protein